MQKDYIGRQALNSIFGDAIVGQRVPDILCQFQYGIDPDVTIETTSGTGVVSATGSVVTVDSGASTGVGKLESTRFLRYQPGFDGYALFTAAFSEGDEGSFQHIGLADENNGFLVAQIDGVFGIIIRNDGVDTFKSGKDLINGPTVTVVKDWHGFDTTKVNIYRISYGWLGVAPVMFEVYAGYERGWVPIYIYDVSNMGLTPSILQPAQPIHMAAGRTSGSGSVTVKSSSWSAGRVGTEGILPADKPNNVRNSKAGITLLTSVLTIRNKATYKGLVNKIVVELDFLGLSSDGTKSVGILVIEDATLGGAPNYNDVATNSVVEYDIAGTTVTDGNEVLPVELSKDDSEGIDLSKYYIDLLPGHTITIAATSQSATEVGAGLRWRELF